MKSLEFIIIVTLKTIEQKGITLNKALIDSGAGKDFIVNMRKGQYPSIKKFADLADYLNVSIDYLLGRTEEPKMIIYQSATPEGKSALTIPSGITMPTAEDLHTANAARQRAADQSLPGNLSEEAVRRIVDERVLELFKAREEE